MSLCRLGLGVAIIITISRLTYAASAEWDEHATHLFWYQLINVGLLFAALVYFLRKSVADFFVNRYQQYCQQAEQSEKSRQEAEAALMDLQRNITKTKASWNEALLRAETESADWRKRKYQEAEEKWQNSLAEYKRALQAESDRMLQEWAHLLVERATEQVIKKIQEKVSQDQHQQLQNELAKRIEGAQL